MARAPKPLGNISSPVSRSAGPKLLRINGSTADQTPLEQPGDHGLRVESRSPCCATLTGTGRKKMFMVKPSLPSS
jgi:hypothetical protein